MSQATARLYRHIMMLVVPDLNTFALEGWGSCWMSVRAAAKSASGIGSRFRGAYCRILATATVVFVVLALGPGASAPAKSGAPARVFRPVVVVDGQDLTLREVVSVARDGAAVMIPQAAMQRVQQSFDVLLEAAREDKPIYGLTRGVGENKDKTVFPGGQITPEGRKLSEQFNANLLRVQAAATGPPATVEVVRAAMVIRLNTMLIGHTGVEASVVQGIEDFINHGITPVVPTLGTVGEADIDILSHIGLALMGEGDVYYAGKSFPAATALQSAGLTPLVPFGKDALSIFSSNAYSAAIAVLAAVDAEHMLVRTRLVFALSLEGLNGNVAPFLAAAQDVRAFPGQATVAAALRDDLSGSYLFSLDPARALQDPLSYRTFSQVVGSADDILARLESQARHTDQHSGRQSDRPHRCDPAAGRHAPGAGLLRPRKWCRGCRGSDRQLRAVVVGTGD